MHHKFIPALIGIVIIGVIGGLAYWRQSNADAMPVPGGPQAGDAAQAYAAADVATHDTAADCWAIINDGIYDLTTWIPRHPGGERAIEGLCGTDGSAAFNAQHSGGAAQQAILADLKVGTLAQ